MNRRCPRCGIRFEREPGYFSGAIWIGLILAFPVTLAFVTLFFMLLPSVHPGLLGFFATLCFLPLLPVILRLSRSLWMYFDHQIQPERRRSEPPPPPIDRPDTGRIDPTGTRTVVASDGTTRTYDLSIR